MRRYVPVSTLRLEVCVESIWQVLRWVKLIKHAHMNTALRSQVKPVPLGCLTVLQLDVNSRQTPIPSRILCENLRTVSFIES